LKLSKNTEIFEKTKGMNLNVWAYCIYIIITIIVTVWVGWVCHKNGIYFIIDCVKDEAIAHSINNLLLAGYYLLNIGYAIITISGWDTITSIPNLLDVLAFRLALIIILLAIVHYVNIALLSMYPTFLKRKQINI
jgi:hypothetical protein